MRYTVERCGIVILAAGSSSRLGSPKQLLLYKGKSLLQQAAGAALQTNMRPVIVVVGANSSIVKKVLAGLDVKIVEHEGWQEGLASSLRHGLAALQQIEPGIDGVILMVCDQPYVTGPLLDCLLLAQKETGQPIVASCYDKNSGTPALFHKRFFVDLMELKGDTGARILFKKYEGLLTTVPFADGGIDIDTKADYEGLPR